MKITKKLRGFGLGLKTIQGKNGTYLYFRTRKGGYHVFTEVEAKEAAKDCGTKAKGNTRQMCKEVWDRN